MEKEALGASREYEQVHPMPTTIRNSMQANHSTTALLSTTVQPMKEGEEQKVSAEKPVIDSSANSVELKGRFTVLLSS